MTHRKKRQKRLWTQAEHFVRNHPFRAAHLVVKRDQGWSWVQLEKRYEEHGLIPHGGYAARRVYKIMTERHHNDESGN